MTGASTTALIVVDVQNDFCPGGALGVDGGDQLAAVIAEAAAGAGTLVATRDVHPADHISFREQGGPWPPHCVEGTPGAELHPSVAGMSFDIVQDKGRDRAREQYSDFDGTDLADRLRERGVRRVLVAGLATDYCVRATALDAIAAGFETTVLRDAIAAVDVEPGDGERALARCAPPAARSTASTCCAAASGSSRCWRPRCGGCARWWRAPAAAAPCSASPAASTRRCRWPSPPARSAPRTCTPSRCPRATRSRCTSTTPAPAPPPPGCPTPTS